MADVMNGVKNAIKNPHTQLEAEANAIHFDLTLSGNDSAVMTQATGAQVVA